ncbi:hypothetical protein EWM64_g1343 [Hericium alpestre]|uniref:Uncharacterized protein n=1 Tax=Hericium alpestre TaxID=135208 RepID=A0A4Z0A7F8_9AGAM|nr:hypothetical protein EWM64_g1343 [Hericium alpestre]
MIYAELSYLLCDGVMTVVLTSETGPINVYHSSLIPTSPSACIGKTSNASSTASSTALPDLSKSTASAINSMDPSNLTVFSNTTTTTFLDPNDVPTLSNYNFTLSGNSTDLPGSLINLGNSTLVGNATVSSNSTDLSSSTSTSDSTDSGDASSAGNSADSGSNSDSSSDNSTSSATSTGSANATSLPGSSSSTSAAKKAGKTLPAAGFPLSDTPAVPVPLNAKSVIPRWLRMRVPKFRRIAQADLSDVAQRLAGSMRKHPLASGGDIVTTDPCAQQDNADAMIVFAKSPGVTNSAALIANAIAYRKHPRNALNIGGVVPSTPYCQKAPKNPELKGVVNDQPNSVDPGIFGGPDFPLVAFGDG